MRQLILLLAIVPCGWKAKAQTQLYQFFKEANTLSRPDVRYDYTVRLIEQKSGALIDSISGRIYKRGIEYVDSSDVAWTAVSGSYYCKLDYLRKEARVYDIDLIQRKLHLSIDRNHPTASVIVPDSVMLRSGHVTLDSSGGLYRYRCTVASLPGVSLTAVIQKAPLRLVSMTYETTEIDGDLSYRRSCVMYHITNELAPSAFNLAPVFTVAGSKVSLNSKYSGYKLKTLIN